MELISGAERNQLFESFAHDAFHLELRDDYSVQQKTARTRVGSEGQSTTRSWRHGLSS